MSLQMRECLDFVVWLLNFCNLFQVFLFTMYLSIEVWVVGVPCPLYGWMWGVCTEVCMWVHVLSRSMYMGLVVGCSGVVDVWEV